MTTNRIQSETDKALEKCDYKCVVCGWNSKNNKGETMLQGAHLKPHCELDRDTYEDIVALCPNCHIELDNYKYYFSNDGENKVYIENGNKIVIPLFHNIKYIKPEYFGYREYIYLKNNKG